METLKEKKFNKLSDENLHLVQGGWRVLTDPNTGAGVAYSWVNERGATVSEVTMVGGLFGFNDNKFKQVRD